MRERERKERERGERRDREGEEREGGRKRYYAPTKREVCYQSHLFSTVYSVLSEDWLTPGRDPYPSQSIGMNLVTLHQTTPTIMLELITATSSLITSSLHHILPHRCLHGDRDEFRYS